MSMMSRTLRGPWAARPFAAPALAVLHLVALALLVAAPTFAGVAPPPLLMSEIVLTPSAAEYVEIYNPNAFSVDLSDVYLTDAVFAPNGTFYYNLPTGTNAGGGGFGDFHARFPSGASIGPGAYQTVSIAGSDDFFATYGEDPTYELYEDGAVADAVPDMREATAGSIDTTSPSSLSNSGEVVILYYWDGASDLVGDLDYAVWGDQNEAVDKTGVSIDGPDADGDATTFQPDTAIASQDILAATGHAPGEAFVRDDIDEGTETQVGGNGVDGNDETSENVSVTWTVDTPSPNTGFLGQIVLTVDDVAVLEGDSGTGIASFTVSLSKPAPVGGVQLDIATQDDTATVSGADYNGLATTGASITEGFTTYTFDVTVLGDTVPEENERFLVNVTNVVGTSVVVGDGVGEGIIVNDDPVEIFQIQGSGDASTFAGFPVQTNGNVVTAVGTDGFAIQTPSARDDLDPDTSNGVWIQLDVVPTVSVGDLVDIVADVEEFFGLTRLINVTTLNVVGTGAVPAPVMFGPTVPSPDPTAPSCSIEYECYEGMRVQVTSGLVVGPNLSFGTDPIAEVQVVAGSQRPFRDPGVEFPGIGGAIPVWDGNPEVFELDTDRLGLMPDLISSGTTFSATGVLGFEFGDYEIWPTVFNVTPMAQPLAATPVRPAAADEMTIGSLNLLRLFDTVDDPTVSDTVLTPMEYTCRRDKFAAYIEEVLRLPDVLAVQECENLGVLQDMAADLLATTGAVYSAHLVDGNDPGGIDVGFLVKDTVTVGMVTQLGAGEDLPSGSPVHDRPPLLLEATYTAGGASFPFAVMAQHTRSFIGIDDPDSADFVRGKRLAQAQSIAQKVQDFQVANPTVPLVVTGDLNAFEFTDGYVDLVGQIAGNVDPAQNLLSEATITDPPLVNEVTRVPANERYSFIFDGTSQVLDHALTSLSAWPFVRGLEYGRGNADSPRPLLDVCDAGDPLTLPLRSSDHDGLVLYLLFEGDTVIFGDGFESGDLRAWSTVFP